MFWKKKHETNVTLVANKTEESFDIMCYEPEVWKKLCPDQPEEARTQMSDTAHLISTRSRVINVLPKKVLKGVLRQRIIVLDEKFLEFAGDQVQDPKAVDDYCKTISDEQATELFQKHSDGKEYLAAYLSVIGLTEDCRGSHSLRIPKQACQELEEYFTEFCRGNCKVHVPGYVVTSDAAIEHDSRIKIIGSTMIEEGRSIRLGALETQRFPNPINLFFVHIPIIFGVQHESAILENRRMNSFLMYTALEQYGRFVCVEENFECCGFSNMPNLPELPLVKAIEQALEAQNIKQATVMPFLSTAEGIRETEYKMMHDLQKEFKKSKTKLQFC